MKCPHCGKEIVDSKQPYRPFCSERCKLIDLGKWISGEYRVPEPDKDDNSEENSMKDPEEQ
jgi:endogenous inhibitor of DNA gyrase (YacG/DUF329 family)